MCLASPEKYPARVMAKIFPNFVVVLKKALT